MQKQGIIVKLISEFCYVKVKNDSVIYECKAKGIFRHQKLVPIVGDKVKIEIQPNEKGVITEIIDRKNELYRPKIANIDQVIIICSIKEPDFNSYLLDKYLALIEYKDLTPIIVFTKKDLVSLTDPIYESYLNWYAKLGYQTCFISNKVVDPVAWAGFEKLLTNKISVFTGQTGSGKSSTLNSLFNEDVIKTQLISKALGRGKHTTTTTELYDVLGGMIADSPGFSSFDIKGFTKKDLAISYQNFAKYSSECKFRGCLHNQEPGCKIKELVENYYIPMFFYQDYLKILGELERG
ncbi:ribosome small subunit-dependent GTPase A [Spiroplasma eriocheiris]|uniref:Small ribosomal subunit biogenesis GTPase RsgA n=1 Tax=Spiroplasma eriocheiris TaxID=315358 RepID=A0A0H3XN37_9MOLU|nr:ribosome small subunit-dependent GTPase A [Spiroplasma eriocheiris]AHF58124.1 putative ribosome-associated GTPase [Spiroplasma eriocheiris CCTCC M 207170]AKM54562.1 ribosome biogenesis GTPase [Spiroplasma eriocheiris]